MKTTSTRANRNNIFRSESGHSNNQPRRRWFAALLATGLAAVSIFSYAHETNGIDTHHGTGMHGITYAQMDLAHLHMLGHHVLDSASPDQKTKIMAIADAVRPELETLNEQAIDAHRAKVELLLQDNIDPVALEQARIKELQVADELSTKIDEALVQLIKVMTPEQRAQLKEHVKEHLG
jgi:Spy/CpxP family protein refolding chaperone